MHAKQVSDLLVQGCLGEPKGRSHLDAPRGQDGNTLLGIDGAMRLRCSGGIFDPVVHEFTGCFYNGTALLLLKGGSASCLSGAGGLIPHQAII